MCLFPERSKKVESASTTSTPRIGEQPERHGKFRMSFFHFGLVVATLQTDISKEPLLIHQWHIAWTRLRMPFYVLGRAIWLILGRTAGTRIPRIFAGCWKPGASKTKRPRLCGKLFLSQTRTTPTTERLVYLTVCVFNFSHSFRQEVRSESVKSMLKMHISGCIRAISVRHGQVEKSCGPALRNHERSRGLGNIWTSPRGRCFRRVRQRHQLSPGPHRPDLRDSGFQGSRTRPVHEDTRALRPLLHRVPQRPRWRSRNSKFIMRTVVDYVLKPPFWLLFKYIQQPASTAVYVIQFLVLPNADFWNEFSIITLEQKKLHCVFVCNLSFFVKHTGDQDQDSSM